MKKIFLLFLIASLVPFTTSALLCTALTPSVCPGNTIYNLGFGAVELCDNCYVCGAADGVCPDDFSDGTILDQNDDRTRVAMKIGVSSRPQGEIFESNNFRLIHSTGNAACASIGASCSSILTKQNTNDAFEPATEISCSDSVELLNFTNYYTAQCENVPRRGNCLNCPDPDCGAQVRGLAYDRNTGNLIPGARIVLTSNANTQINNLDLGAITSSGTYEFDGVRGRLNVQCSYEGYNPISFTKTLTLGTNIIDCPLERAQCTPQCTIPDASGNEICRASCDESNSCGYLSGEFNGMNYNFADICDGRRVDSFVVLGRENSTHVQGVTCCTGALESIYRPQFSLQEQNNIRNVLTRDYSRQIEEEPVTVRIIVYER